MTVEPIGYILVLLGALCVMNGARFTVVLLCLSTLLGAAAAINLPVLGGASIQPAHFVVAFLVLSCLMRPVQARSAILSLKYPGPGFWFAAYVIYSVLSAFFLPRIFAGATTVYSSARDAAGTISTIAAPLSPGTSNITQSVYLLGDLVCFAVVCGFAQMGYARFIAHAIVATAFACLLFALLDIGTFLAGVPEVLDIIRNANYTMHTAETISGFKRIVGSFPEASAYGSVALALFSFTLMLWLERFPSRLVGLVTLGLGISIALCTSTTAYVASVVVLCLVIALSVTQLFSSRRTMRHAILVGIAVLAVPVTILGLMLVPHIWNALGDLASMTLVDKIDSQSGEERTAWNTYALIAFLQTSTFGGGLGTVRASSFGAALLSNIGIPGTALFLVFLYSLTKTTWQTSSHYPGLRSIALAGLISSIAQITSATISGSSTDLSLLFSVIAGLSAGCARVTIRSTGSQQALPEMNPIFSTARPVATWP